MGRSINFVRTVSRPVCAVLGETEAGEQAVLTKLDTHSQAALRFTEEQNKLSNGKEERESGGALLFWAGF